MKKLIFTLVAIAFSFASFSQTVNKSCVFDLFSKDKKIKEKAYIEVSKVSPNFVATANGGSDILVMPTTERGFKNYYENHLRNIPENDSIVTRIREGSAWTPEEEQLGVTLYVVCLFKNGKQINAYSFCWIGNELKSVMDENIK